MNIPPPQKEGVWKPGDVRALLVRLGFHYNRRASVFELVINGHPVTQVTNQTIDRYPDALGEYFLGWLIEEE